MGFKKIKPAESSLAQIKPAEFFRLNLQNHLVVKVKACKSPFPA
jgi:hypothetical protein